MLYERRWLAVTAIGLSLFLSALDATIVALALPAIAHHFQLSDSLVSIVTLSSAQMSGGMLIIDGFAVLNLLFAWLSLQSRSQHLSPSEALEVTSNAPPTVG